MLKLKNSINTLFTVITFFLLVIIIMGGSKAVKKSGWDDAKKLIDNQRYEEASKIVANLREDAEKKGDEEQWTRFLIEEVKLRIGLHGYETAVRFLLENKWPPNEPWHSITDLYYANSLAAYQQSYSWEIAQRERVEAADSLDLKLWTQRQIYNETQKAFEKVFSKRKELEKIPITKLTEYIQPNNYPSGVRDTMRDAVSYLFTGLLAQTNLWSPEESNEIYMLNIDDLIKGIDNDNISLSNENIHPLIKISYILYDLEKWHEKKGEYSGSLEAYLERMRRLHSSFTNAEDKQKIKNALIEKLKDYRNISWWSNGMALLADFVQDEDRPDNLIEAHKILDEGYKAYPDSNGGNLCFINLKRIELPDFNMQSMFLDGANKRSVEVEYTNMKTLYFRAYYVDLMKQIQSSYVRGEIQPSGNEIKKIMEGKPAVEWKESLPPVTDYKSHKTHISPPLKSKGLFVIVASMNGDFLLENNITRAANIIISDIVITRLSSNSNRIITRMIDGEDGKPVKSAEAMLYKYDWHKPVQIVEKKITDANGEADFVQDSSNNTYFLVVKKGDDISIYENGFYFYKREKSPEKASSFIHTDRSIYRPGQKILWKVVSYSGFWDKGSYKTLANSPITISLKDENSETVESITKTTNDFGSVSGEFTIPTGRMLGSWSIESSLNGEAEISVEEYKRPTFEVAVNDPENPLRLNHKALLTGSVKYYFGLPVVNCSVKYTIAKEPLYPWWWWYYGHINSSKTQTIASGNAETDETGKFSIEFTPIADERLGPEGKNVTYRYTVSADATDEGGETNSISRSIRIGFSTVEAVIGSEEGFFENGETAEFKITRSDLNGIPRIGKGRWRINQLIQVDNTLLPADMPSPVNEKDNPYKTPEDRIKARWETSFNYEWLIHGWKDGKEMSNGDISTGDKGTAELKIKLTSGVYRLHYETADDLGEKSETEKDFIVSGKNLRLSIPLVLIPKDNSVSIGNSARYFIHSGFHDQQIFLEIYRNNKPVERRIITSESDNIIEIPVSEEDRGGINLMISTVKDFQFLESDKAVFVPWDNKELHIEFSSFRDKIHPNQKETWTIKIKDNNGKKLDKDVAEILSYMYDRSLDVFVRHNTPTISNLYKTGSDREVISSCLRVSYTSWYTANLPSLPGYIQLYGDSLKNMPSYGIGGPGGRMDKRRMFLASAPPSKAEDKAMPASPRTSAKLDELSAPAAAEAPEESGKETGQVPLRSNFAETAFWLPSLRTDENGSAKIEFTVPDSLTSWNVWAHAITRNLRGGSIKMECSSVKDLMVRPYLPRFLREGDKAEIKVVVNNAGGIDLKGTLSFDILDPETNKSISGEFGISPENSQKQFSVNKGGGDTISFDITAPKRVGSVAVKVTAAAGGISDGELRTLPILPSRMHLIESRFVTLRNDSEKNMIFPDIAKDDDPSRMNEQMVITVDAQLFYSTIECLPYLVNYPYECTEQTLNRFLSTGIVSSLYEKYPAIEKMAKEMSSRNTQLETWDQPDPNRRMSLEETPWLTESRGGKSGLSLSNILDSRIAKAERDLSIAKLKKMQTASGGFPWWPGGPPSPYMTLYIMHGLGRASEFGVDVPRDVVQNGWHYLAEHFREDYAKRIIKGGCCFEFLTFLNYVSTCYPDSSWMGDALSESERKQILNFSFKHWKEHSPYLKCYLALTLKRMGRAADANLIFGSVMDSAKTDEEMGTYWAPEDRAWLWYNDTIETHAFALRTLMEISPDDSRRHGLVQWLFLNKKLNHWNSTRATAEVIYSLIHYLKKEGALGVRESVSVQAVNERAEFIFEPDKYTGKKNQIVIPGNKIDRNSGTISVEKEGKGFAFASAAWHFSTDKLPEKGEGDFFSVSRTYFLRQKTQGGNTLKPITNGDSVKIGDEVEIHISITSKHPAEYIHLRDPRPSGFEPASATSRYKWDLGISWYEEVRDSGTNFFFETLPQGEYTFKYRIRANMAGTFRIAPAEIQSMYAPEFNAFSSGFIINVSSTKAAATELSAKRQPRRHSSEGLQTRNR